MGCGGSLWMWWLMGCGGSLWMWWLSGDEVTQVAVVVA
jgi:hypothetical protein